MRNHRAFFGLMMVLALMGGQHVYAQSTLFNIPSTDAVGAGSVYAEFDFLSQMPKTAGADRLNVFAPRFVVGIPGGLEAGSNFFIFKAGSTNQSYFQPNVKWRFAANDDKGVAASAGTILYVPMNNRSTADDFGLVYGNFSKKVKTGNYGPRFTIGPYGIYSGGSGWVGSKAGVIAALEQPIHPKVTLLADWFSGKNFFGYFTPGVSFTLPQASLLNIGYSIGNDSWAEPHNNNRALFIYYGITLP